MENINLPIINHGRISIFFVKATRYLLNMHSEKFKSLINTEEKIQLLVELWEYEFGCRVNLKNGIPDSAQFLSKSAMISFFLKFGN